MLGAYLVAVFKKCSKNTKKLFSILKKKIVKLKNFFQNM